MTDRPIIFSAPMVRAILDGRKTMTRRVLKPQPFADGYHEGEVTLDRLWEDGDARFSASAVGGGAMRECIVPTRYAVGDRLWVREAFAQVGTVDPGWLLYRASGYDAECERHGFSNFPPESEVKWRPSIHMPRWASRITLEVTGVRVERLQDISEADAKAEGVFSFDAGELGTLWTWQEVGQRTPRSSNVTVSPAGWQKASYAFANLWESINGPGAREANPWVAVIEFKRTKQEPSNG